MKKILKWVAIAFVLLIILALIFGSDKQQETTTSPTATETTGESAPAAPPVEVTANDLLKAYKDNEIAANNKFKDKSILVSATLKSIGADFSDKPDIR